MDESVIINDERISILSILKSLFSRLIQYQSHLACMNENENAQSESLNKMELTS